jgi:predicted RNA-binding Zn-ribbon protein involved in translation (DUF1610 family)
MANNDLSIRPLMKQARATTHTCWKCGTTLSDNLSVDVRQLRGMTTVDIYAECPVCGEDDHVLAADARDGDTVWTIDTDL